MIYEKYFQNISEKKNQKYFENKKNHQVHKNSTFIIKNRKSFEEIGKVM